MASTFTTPETGAVSGLRRWFDGFIRKLAINSRGYLAAREVERLSALSDLELARLGLTRDRIVQHAFAGLMHN